MRGLSRTRRPREWAAAALAAVLTVAALAFAAAHAADPFEHGIAMHGEPALPPDFQHLPYVNPAAPKGGTVTLAELGSFDSLNPLIVKGVAANGIRELVYESLLGRALHEPFSLYGLIARRVEMPEDRRSITFELEPEARFADGHPITPADVIFSWQLLKERGQPYHRSNYKSVTSAEMAGPHTVRFTFEDDGNREAPLLIGLMPILPSHRTDPQTFEQTTLAPPVGSGPYVVAAVDTGRRVVYKRDPGWWGRDKPINRGRFNFDEIRYEFFRDQTSMFEAFKAGEIRVRLENDAARWAEGYTFPAATDGRIIRETLATRLPAGMTALVFNTRRPVFADPRVRRALTLLFDFEWVNRSFFHGNYTRTQSFFERSELSSHGVPADPRELELLAPFKERIDPALLQGTFKQPVSDGTGHNRANWQAAFKLLAEAGFVQEGGRLVHKVTRQPLAFEMMAGTRAEERLMQAFAAPLERLGIAVSIRQVDSAQRWARMKTFDFDMVQWTWHASLSPGNEQMNRWSVASATTELSLNYAGVKDPAVDTVIEAILAAHQRPQFVSAVRALDRLLLSGSYVIPLYHAKSLWVARWKELARPDVLPLSGFALDTWWVAK
ncbi:MAG TPA: extracellular solute-binding protein [Hyphomicrobiaceae bacterium]|nr:extracellular solute-binding protein [Hyphomicrobiaceae bacterium]